MPREWYCNTEWTPAIERRFYEKLTRARRKPQYLQNQAGLLSTSRPDVALKLIDEYFAVSDGLFDCVAYTIRGDACAALGRIGDAIAAHEASIACERSQPGIQSTSTIGLPYLIATAAVRKQYPLASRLLKRWKGRIVFLVDHFRWHASQALIAADLRRSKQARVHAERALEIAASQDSGVRHHPGVGLVTPDYAQAVRQLERIRDARTPRGTETASSRTKHPSGRGQRGAR